MDKKLTYSVDSEYIIDIIKKLGGSELKVHWVENEKRNKENGLLESHVKLIINLRPELVIRLH